MSLNATPPNLYPLATAKGQSIPLEVARPRGSFSINAPSNSEIPLVLPDALNLITCMFDKQMELWIVNPPDTPVSINTYAEGRMILLPNVAYDLAVPQLVWLDVRQGATLGHINVIETWAQLQNSNYEVS